MIVFDLQCDNNHRFEGWFDDLNSFENQAKRGLVNCPVCESTNIVRIPSTFGIKSSAPVSLDRSGEVRPEEALLKQFSQYVKENFDDVGSRFAEEALKIHYGVKEPRNIRGASTKEQEKMLAEEGVPFVKFPIAASDDSEA